MLLQRYGIRFADVAAILPLRRAGAARHCRFDSDTHFH